MSLRAKFQLLLAVFGVSIVANVLISVWCIGVYMEQATSRFHVLMSDVQRIDSIRGLLDDLVDELEGRAERTGALDDARYRVLHRRIKEQLAELPASDDPQRRQSRDRLVELSALLSDRSEQYVVLLQAGRRDEATELLAATIEREYAAPMRKELGRIAGQSSTSITRTSQDVNDKQALVTAVLSLNALVAFLLAAAGVHLVRNWVLKPVAALKTAAERHAAGDLQYRIPRHSSDELGTLSREVNRMADSLAVIQRRLLEQERLAAVGEVASSVAHNIRNPLASIRASAQSSVKDSPSDGDIRANQVRIIETVDSLNRWLRELLMVNMPIELECRAVVVRALVDRVVEVTRSFAERRGIHFQVEESPTGCMAQVDASRIEQALLAVVSNAVEASPAGVVVRIAIGRRPEPPERVELRVIDSGPGIPPAILDRVASPYFTTKPGGTGMGLHLARRIVQAHKGAIEFQNNAGGGTTVTLWLPPSASADSGAPAAETPAAEGGG